MIGVCPELVGATPADVGGDSIVAFLGPIGTDRLAFLVSPAIDYKVAILDATTLALIEVVGFDGLLSPDYEGSSLVDNDGNLYEWRRDTGPTPDTFTLERWERSGADYVLVDGALATWVNAPGCPDNAVLGTAFWPRDGHLYTFNMQVQTVTGAPTGLRRIHPVTGAITDRGPGFDNGGFVEFVAPVIGCDGATWMPGLWFSGDGIIRVKRDGTLNGAGLDWGSTPTIVPLGRETSPNPGDVGDDVLVWWDAAPTPDFYVMFSDTFAGHSPLSQNGCDLSVFSPDFQATGPCRTAWAGSKWAYLWSPGSGNVWRVNPMCPGEGWVSVMTVERW